MKFEIVDEKVNEKKGTSAKSGKPYHIREQEAMVELNGERRRVKVPLDDEQAPYPAGVYTLDDSSFFVGRFGDLQVRARLVNGKGR